jgi:predicted metal-binding membrane protein
VPTENAQHRGRAAVEEQPVAALSNRDRVVIFGCVTGVTVVAWLYLVHLGRAMAPTVEGDAMMAAMDSATTARWSASDLLFMLAMWCVMMAGMMAPAAAPVMLLFAGMQAKRGARSVSAIVLAFALGYAAVWLAFGAAAALAQWLLHNGALLSPQMAAASPLAGGAILCMAGVYQLLPMKAACLDHCRSPLGFLMTHWRDGKRGAFAMGARHGAWCLGCCFALMSVLFAVGVMNLAWVAALALFVLLEKTGPAYALVARAGGGLLLGAGILMLARG